MDENVFISVSCYLDMSKILAKSKSKIMKYAVSGFTESTSYIISAHLLAFHESYSECDDFQG